MEDFKNQLKENNDFTEDINKLRIDFEEDLNFQNEKLNQELKNYKEDINSKKNMLTHKKLIRNLLISIMILAIIFFVMRLYASTIYKENNDNSLNTYKTIIQLKVNKFKSEMKRCPINSIGEFDIYALKNKGYIDDFIESKLSYYTLNQDCQVVTKTD